MKLLKYSLFSLLLISLPDVALAQNVEQIYMKSGSVVEGYIAEQKPGKYITVQTTKATIVANSDSLQNRVIERIPLESLSNEWREWAEKNNKYVENNGVKQLELSTLEFNNSRYSNVYVLEKGSIIKFLDLNSNSYRFVWGDMYRTVKSKRPENLFSSLKEVLILSDNSKVVGQIIEQFPGKDLKIVTEEGEILSFKFSQIKQIRTEKLTEKLDLWSQIQLLDKITVKGVRDELIGFISSRTLGKELVFEFEDGSKRTIPQNKITSYAKIANDKYVEVYDKILKEGEILLNGENNIYIFEKLDSYKEYIVLDEKNVSAQLFVGDTICLETKMKDVNLPINLIKAYEKQIPAQNGRKWSYKPYIVFTFQDLIQSNLPVSREITPLGNIKVTFVVKQAGDYVLHIQGVNGYIIINVKNQ